MAFQVERVNEMICPRCKYRIDTSACKALSDVRCPSCGETHTVPAKLGSMVILKLMGQGTASVVYEAEDRVLGKRVALKVMRAMKETDVGKQSGLDEARALLLLDHPNVVKVYAIDTRRGQPCIIMELLRGGSLKDVLENQGPVDEKRGLRIGIQLASALSATTARGLLHLDVKPGNVMFDENGNAKLLDFGYAAVDPDEDRNEILGTPYYVSPELVRQMPPDFKADIYSLGATLFHIMTGEAPFEAQTIKQILLKRLNTTPPDILKYKPTLSIGTARIISKMMQEDPADRYANYTELVSDLEFALHAVTVRSGATADAMQPAGAAPGGGAMSRGGPAAAATGADATAPHRPLKPKLRSIRTSRDAEAQALAWMRYMGFADALCKEIGTDDPIDVRGSGVAAQVKTDRKPADKEAVLAMRKHIGTERALMFSFSGFTPDAIEAATHVGIGLFRFNTKGEIDAINMVAKDLYRAVGH